MNAAQLNKQVDPESGDAAWLSALADGEATMAELDEFLGLGQDAVDLHSRWHRYQVTSEVLRGSLPHLASRSPKAFLAGVMAGLPEANGAPLKLETVSAFAHVRAAAANDAVMRWKWLAGAASVAAVMAVSWGVLRTAPGAVDGGSAGRAQLAIAVQDSPRPVALSEPVEVKTAQGTLIRDARLEQLLAEHRQYGGASALQMPAGFLRNATYEAAPQR